MSLLVYTYVTQDINGPVEVYERNLAGDKSSSLAPYNPKDSALRVDTEQAYWSNLLQSESHQAVDLQRGRFFLKK